MKHFFSVRLLLTIFLALSLGFAGYSMYYKIKYWGFSLSPKQSANVWDIEAHITFTADNSPVKVSLGIPTKNKTALFMFPKIDMIGAKIRIFRYVPLHDKRNRTKEETARK